MSTVFDLTAARSSPLTAADLLKQLGPIPLHRIRNAASAGTATEADLRRRLDRGDRLCELVDGILVEKAVGSEESLLAFWIGTLLNNFVRPRKLGAVLGIDSAIRLSAGLVRLPDVCFISRDRLPGGRFPKQAILDIVPNLAVEVLSRSNTSREMRRKLRDYFKAGVEVVWFVNAKSRTVEVFSGPAESVVLKESQTLGGGEVLPGFKVKLRELFADLDDA